MEIRTPLISIIVPVYNVSSYIKKCLESLIYQSLKNIEIILVDDGSTDGSGSICDYYAARYGNIKAIHGENGGLGMARNRGLEIARGEYVGFVDSDDFVAENMFEILYQNAEQHNADISYCEWQRFVNEDIQIEKKAKMQLQIWSGKAEIKNYLLNRIGLPPESKEDNFYGAVVCGGIFRRQIIEKYGIRFVSERVFIAEDIIFDIDIINHCKTIVHCDLILYFYRYNPNSLTTMYRRDRFEKNVILYHEMYKRLEMNFSKIECFNSMSRYLLTFARIGIIQESLFMKENGRAYAIESIKKICKSIELQEVLKRYPFQKMPAKYKYLCFLEKKRAAHLILLLSEIFYIRRKRKHDT